MKLYYAKGACSLAVRITLAEMGMDCDYVAVDLGTKKTATGDDFLAINPKGSVPALGLDNGEVLTENTVIQQYLADTYHAELLPHQDNLTRYRVLEWLNYVSTELHKTCAPLFNPKLPSDLKDTYFKPLFRSKLDFVDRHLAQHTYLIGEAFSLADSYLFVILLWLPHFGLALADWPHLQRYFTAVKQRPAVLAALQAEGLS